MGLIIDAANRVLQNVDAGSNTGVPPPAPTKPAPNLVQAQVGPLPDPNTGPRVDPLPDPGIQTRSVADPIPAPPSNLPPNPLARPAPSQPANSDTGLINSQLPPPPMMAEPSYAPSSTAAADPTVGARTMVSNNAVNEPERQTASTIGATLGTVDNKSLVQQQLEQLLAADSPLMQQARSKALQTANARGLINSTMAAQSGEEAAIASALPIAQQDAATNFQQSRANQDATNQFSMTDKNFENTQSLADFQQQAQRASQAEAANEQLKSQEQNYQDTNSMFERDNALKEKLTGETLASNERQAAMQANATMGAAQIHAQAELQGAQLSAAVQREQINANYTIAQQGQQLQRDAMNLDASTRLQITHITTDAQVQTNMNTLQQNTLANYGQQMTSIMSAQMEPEARQAAINNLTAIYGGSPYLPVSINTNAFHPTTTNTNTTPAPNPNNNGGGG